MSVKVRQQRRVFQCNLCKAQYLHDDARKHWLEAHSKAEGA